MMDGLAFPYRVVYDVDHTMRGLSYFTERESADAFAQKYAGRGAYVQHGEARGRGERREVIWK